MTNKVEDTQLALILAGGELFAENGFKGTSTRAIAIKAGANIAAINYHFGNKEKLYAEVLHHAVMASRGNSLEDFIPDTNLEKNPELVEKIVFKIVEELFEVRFSKDCPAWFDKILMRALFERPSGLEDIVRRSFQPNHELMKRLALRANPVLTENQAHHWVLSVFGQIMIYTFAKDAILTVLEIPDYSPNFINEAVLNVTRVSIAGLYSLHQEGTNGGHYCEN
jgi:AcrR family transcriptional regulator